jgi:ELWxxDGT repeat protein
MDTLANRTASVLLLLGALLGGPARAQAAESIAAPVIDLNTSFGSSSSGPRQLTPLRGGRLLFVTATNVSGYEIWSSDGTDVGTRLLVDSCPGPCSPWPTPEILGTVGGIGLFAAGPVEAPDRLWRSDGTPDGTFQLTDDGAPLAAVRDPGDPELSPYLPLAPVFRAGRMYFKGCGDLHGCGLWSTDGGEARPVVSNDVLGGTIEHTMSAGDRGVFFVVASLAGRSVWRTDGTAAGTVRLLASGYSDGLTAAGNRVYFLAAANNREELWVSDGTPAGTRTVTRGQIQSFHPNSFRPAPVFAFGNRIYFAADDGVHSWEVWRSDGTAAGTRRVTDFPDPTAYGFAVEEVNGRAVVTVFTNNTRRPALWATDGDPRSTTKLRDCVGGCAGPAPLGSGVLGRAGGRMLFVSQDAAHGRELWSTDGTRAGTRMLIDLCPGSCSSFIYQDSPLLGGLSFGVLNGSDPQLWLSDGTAAGTRPLTHLSLAARRVQLGSAFPAAAGNRIFFSVVSFEGEQLWVIENGRERQVTNLNPEAPSADPQALTVLGDRLLFQAVTGNGVTPGLWQTRGTAATTSLILAPLNPPARPFSPVMVAAGSWAAYLQETEARSGNFQLWRTDGTPAGTAQLTHIEPPDRIDLQLAALTNGRVLFIVERADRRELWRSDGTPDGTVLVEVIPGSASSPPPASLTALGTEAWLATGEETGGPLDVWRTDGTTAGTVRVASLVGDVQMKLPFVRAGGKVYFATTSPSGSKDGVLWISDGTLSGTRGLLGGPGFSVLEMKEFAGNLFFLIAESAETAALWRTDGTATGLLRLHEFAAVDEERLGPLQAIRPHGLTVLGDRLYFAAKGGPEGTELWASDGTAAGTVLVKDLDPTGPSNPAQLTAAGGRLYFSAFDPLHGVELWQSDGTAAGTHRVQDIAPEKLSSSPDQLTVLGNRLFFAADDNLIGRELWSLPLTGLGGCQPSSTVLCLAGRYRVEVTWSYFDVPNLQTHRGTGTAVPLTADTGAFWFFAPEDLELVVKVLDGQSSNGHDWVFFGGLSDVGYALTVTDTRTGLTRRYINPPGQLASLGDTHAFGPLGAKSATLTVPPSPFPLLTERKEKAAAAPCQASAQRLCLQNGRFAVTVTWEDFQNHNGNGTAVPLLGDTGAFWFFGAENLELIVKVVDGRLVNGKFWLFYGALTNAGYKVTVTDTQTGTVRTYENPKGRFGSVGDTGAF